MTHEFYQQLLRLPLETSLTFYANCLQANPTAVDYLSRNGLSCDSALRVGFSDRTLGKKLPSNLTKLGHQLRQHLFQAGVFKESGHETFRGMITVPLSNAQGNVTGVYGRRVQRPQADALMTQTIGSGIFNVAAIKHSDEIIVTDCVLDAWAIYSAGHTSVICSVHCQPSIEACTHLKRVLLACENIDCEPFSRSCEILRMKFPQGQSIHEYLLTHRTTESDPLGKIIRAATWHSVPSMPSVTSVPHPESSSSKGVGADCAPGARTQAGDNQGIAKAMSDAAPEELMPAELPSVTPHAHRCALGVPPVPPSSPFEVLESDDEATIVIESRRWRVRGLERNMLSGVMKVNLLVTNTRTNRFHVDCFDLYHARSRRAFTAEAADEIGCEESQLRSDLGQVLIKLEELQLAQKSKAKNMLSRKPAEQMSQANREAALDLLKDENLLDRILQDFESCGVVGERTGKLVGYLAATSRLLEKPLGLIIQSSSAAGKSSLAEAIMRFMPEEDRLACSAMTGQSLYYLGKENLQHKILFVSEEEGVRSASYQLKLLQSEGRLSLVATSKESGSGRTTTERYEVEGPVQLLLTTTASDLDPELLNRCLVVGVDESCAQTAAIHAVQRQSETLAGYEAKIRRKQLEQLHQNAQRLLRPLAVLNPYADQLSFVGSQIRYRRDQLKYLTLIRTVALLHQHQREILHGLVDGQKFEYIEVTRRDIAMAGQIADWALGRSIDELAGPTRRLLMELYDWVRQQASSQGIAESCVLFSRRRLREALGWNATQLAYHLEQLCRYEYAVVHGRGSGKLYQYSLLYDGRGREGQPALLGLVDAASLH